jgi:hypothetical protein
MVQPIPVYQSVPVTEMRQVTQTVRKPIMETKYVDQAVTEYKQVMEQQTVQVPQVSYQQVTEYQTQTRDMGQWVSYQQCNPKVSPCEYDSRANLLGWMNRTGYSMRSAVTPSVTTKRFYQPNVVAQQIPITRSVPIQTMQTMTYNVAKVVPVTTNRKVAVNTVRYEDQTVTASVPVTVMKNVQVGTQTAFGFIPGTGTGTQTALGPTPDPSLSAPKTATSKDPNTSMLQTPAPLQNMNPVQPVSQPLLSPNPSVNPISPSPVPSIVQVSGWRARHSTTLAVQPKATGSSSSLELVANQQK